MLIVAKKELKFTFFNEDAFRYHGYDAVFEGRFLQNLILRRDDTSFLLGGQFIVESSYRGKTLVVWPHNSVFDDEFCSQVAIGQEGEENSGARQAYLSYKANKIE